MFSFEADRDDESTESGKEPPLLVWENASLTQEAYPTLVNSSGFVEKGEMMAVLGSLDLPRGPRAAAVGARGPAAARAARVFVTRPSHLPRGFLRW